MAETKLKIRKEFTLRNLRLSLKFRPKIYALIRKMRLCIKKKNYVIDNLKHQLKEMKNISNTLTPDTEKLKYVYNVTDINSEINTIDKNIETNTNVDSEMNKTDVLEDTSENKESIDKQPDNTINTEIKTIASLELEALPKSSDQIKNLEAPTENINNNIKTTDQSTQTDKKITKKSKGKVNDSEKQLNQGKEEKFEGVNNTPEENAEKQKDPESTKGLDKAVPWNINEDKEKSIAEQVKEAAQDAMKESGMVYVESAGMYYDYKTGYYYNSELGLYYHTDTGCYYYYSENKQFVFHSYPDRSAAIANASLIAHEKKKAKKHKMDRKTEEDIDNLTKNLSQDKEDGHVKPKKLRKKNPKKKEDNHDSSQSEKDKENLKNPEENSNEVTSDQKDANSDEKEGANEKMTEEVEDLEDGECSETDSEGSDDEDRQSNISTSTASDDETVAKHHPPCMRIIVRETTLPKLRVGTLFIVTKDGGTIGREGDHHTVLLRDHNVSRNHLDIRYDTERRSYMATDLGSKNGSVLNGSRMSHSQITSEPTEIVHGSTLQLGETKLLCHIHPGNDTCGHCEPGLLMEALEKEKKVAYTRTCNVKMQHEMELARLKNKYAPKQLCIEETAYNDRAQARRETVGSSHHSEKTQSSDLNMSIAADNKGFKLLEKMGWSKGEGLGKDSQGDTEPVPLVSNDGTKGLGAPTGPAAPVVSKTLGPATLRLASKTKMLRPPAKAFQLNEDEESE